MQRVPLVGFLLRVATETRILPSPCARPLWGGRFLAVRTALNGHTVA